MTPEELRQCLEEAFGGLEPPASRYLTRAYGLDSSFEEAVRTNTAAARRWQEVRPLTRYLCSSLNILILTPEACQYYLPAFLYAMTEPQDIRRYLDPVLDRLWYEDEYGDPLYRNPDLRGQWEKLASLLTDGQKRCIAHCLVEILKSADLHMAPGRIDYMLKKYWNAWL